MSEHRWSGWPGAYCLKCGQDDLTELAIADGVLDPWTGEWRGDNREYIDHGCPVSDARWAAHLRQIGEFVPKDIA